MWLDIILKLVPFLVQLAETLFKNKPKSGADKKAWVLSIAHTAMSGVEAVSTGGQAETWDRIQPHVGAIVDATAAIAFPPRTNWEDLK